MMKMNGRVMDGHCEIYARFRIVEKRALETLLQLDHAEKSGIPDAPAAVRRDRKARHGSAGNRT
jgi:hypothetical protein